MSEKQTILTSKQTKNHNQISTFKGRRGVVDPHPQGPKGTRNYHDLEYDLDPMTIADLVLELGWRGWEAGLRGVAGRRIWGGMGAAARGGESSLR